MQGITRSQLQSYIAIVLAVATSIGGSLGAINPKAAAIVALIAAVAASVGRNLAIATDNKAFTVLGIVVAVAGVLGANVDVVPPNWAAGLGIIGTALAAAGRSIWGEIFPAPTNTTN